VKNDFRKGAPHPSLTPFTGGSIVCPQGRISHSFNNLSDIVRSDYPRRYFLLYPQREEEGRLISTMYLLGSSHIGPTSNFLFIMKIIITPR
jgi:hypothetical protein